MSQTTQPKLERIKLVGRDGEPFGFLGAPLGAGTSYREDHLHDRERTPYARRGDRCSACRWFEVAIYRRYNTDGIDLETDPEYPRIYPLDDPLPGDYVIHTVGASAVPGETRLSRISVTDSAYEVVELLTVRRRDEEPWIPAQSARALARASQVDAKLRDAYVNRAVV